MLFEINLVLTFSSIFFSLQIENINHMQDFVDNYVHREGVYNDILD